MLKKPGKHVSQRTPSWDGVVPSAQRRHRLETTSCSGTCVPGKTEPHCSKGMHTMPLSEKRPAAQGAQVLRLLSGALPGEHL